MNFWGYIGIEISADFSAGGKLIIKDEAKLKNAIENNTDEFKRVDNIIVITEIAIIMQKTIIKLDKPGDKLSLEENFIKYKVFTLIIIKIVKAEEYEKLEERFQPRQLILDDINRINYSKDELKKFYLQYEIEKLEKILTTEIKVRKSDLLKKINQNEKWQVGMVGYNNISA